MRIYKNIERAGKRLMRSVLKNIIRPESIAVADIAAEDISKILLVRQDTRLGNLVLMTPMIRALKEVFPDCSIDILISSGMEDIFDGNPAVDDLVIFDKDAAKILPWRYLGLISDLKREKYDIAIDVSNGHHYSFNNVMLTALSGARYSLGYDREDAGAFLGTVMPPLPPDNTHFADALTGLVNVLSPVSGEYGLELKVAETAREQAEKILDENGISVLDSFCIIHPGGRGRKQWGAEHFTELIERLFVETGFPVLVIGGPGEDDIIEMMKKSSNVPFAIVQDISIAEMMALIERCDLFVSNDTGPMHIATALGRCTVAVFTSSNYRVYGPRGNNTRIVTSSTGKPAVDDVLMAIHDLIKSCAS